MSEMEVMPVDRSYIELTEELTALAQALAALEGNAQQAMATYVLALASPRFLVRSGGRS